MSAFLLFSVVKKNEAIKGKGILKKAHMVMTHFLIFVKHLPKSWNTSLLIKCIWGDSQIIKSMLIFFFLKKQLLVTNIAEILLGKCKSTRLRMSKTLLNGSYPEWFLSEGPWTSPHTHPTTWTKFCHGLYPTISVETVKIQACIEFGSLYC